MVAGNDPNRGREKGSIHVRKGVTSSCPGGSGWEFVNGVRNERVSLLSHL